MELYRTWWRLVLASFCVRSLEAAPGEVASHNASANRASGPEKSAAPPRSLVRRQTSADNGDVTLAVPSCSYTNGQVATADPCRCGFEVVTCAASSFCFVPHYGMPVCRSKRVTTCTRQDFSRANDGGACRCGDNDQMAFCTATEVFCHGATGTCSTTNLTEEPTPAPTPTPPTPSPTPPTPSPTPPTPSPTTADGATPAPTDATSPSPTNAPAAAG
eukprot:TRINITY_DN962_c0_g1_i1.p1 TRINITY_DN962_c0_g1~~TRINITY_DN962_c0_g1_i1.p1  ORF type:complete len:217 (-),score=28.97 TRINITY_DN962_c0_g1_i1:160-810(-)